MTFSLGSTPRSLVKYNDQSISAITEIGASAKDSMVLIKELTASGDANLSFVDGTDDVVLDNTYPIYVFKFFDLNPDTDNKKLQFNLSVDTGSNYNVAKTTTWFFAYHDEADTETSLGYHTSNDLAQGTGAQYFTESLGSGADESAAGELHLFNPSSTTFVKHFFSRVNTYHSANYTMRTFVAGYGNTTSAVDAIQFSEESGGNFDGTIKMYGVT